MDVGVTEFFGIKISFLQRGSLCAMLCVYVHVYGCGMCVEERERETDSEKERKKRQRKKKRELVGYINAIPRPIQKTHDPNQQ